MVEQERPRGTFVFITSITLVVIAQILIMARESKGGTAP